MDGRAYALNYTAGICLASGNSNVESKLEAPAQDLVEPMVTAYASVLAEAKLFASDTANCFVEIDSTVSAPMHSTECAGAEPLFSEKLFQDSSAEVGVHL